MKFKGELNGLDNVMKKFENLGNAKCPDCSSDLYLRDNKMFCKKCDEFMLRT
ncbi:hypothetical protein SPD48_14435 [Pseudogracilibacillus sp. SE30717A]|uniref:hypothetical protein n=1 Tax=Pseudogracilibacillus sp. SE30717A TaxID=3098293 RepID=UPI00300E4066